LTGQGATDDTELEMGIGGAYTSYAQPIKFHKNFTTGDTFKIELFVRGGSSPLTNALVVDIYTDSSKSPSAIYLQSTISQFNFIRDNYKKLNAEFTLGTGKSLDKDTIYWLVIKSDEAYYSKANVNLYYQYYTREEFDDTDYVLKQKIADGSWWNYIDNAEMYFKILIPTTSGKIYKASNLGIENNFPKIAIGLSDNNYSIDDTIQCITSGIVEGCSVMNQQGMGNNVYLNYYGGKLDADPVDILRTYAIGQITATADSLYSIKINIESNLLLRAEV